MSGAQRIFRGPSENIFCGEGAKSGGICSDFAKKNRFAVS